MSDPRPVTDIAGTSVNGQVGQSSTGLLRTYAYHEDGHEIDTSWTPTTFPWRSHFKATEHMPMLQPGDKLRQGWGPCVRCQSQSKGCPHVAIDPAATSGLGTFCKVLIAGGGNIDDPSSLAPYVRATNVESSYKPSPGYSVPKRGAR